MKKRFAIETIVFTALFSLFCVWLCSCCLFPKKQELEPEPTIDEKYEMALYRLQVGHSADGWIVSYWAHNGQKEHQGDSAIWTGVSMGAMDCDHSWPQFEALEAEIERSGGFLARFWPLPEEYEGGRELSLDGEVGATFGMVSRFIECRGNAGQSARIKEAWSKHYAAVKALDMQIHPNVDAKIKGGFDYVWQAVSNFILGIDERGFDKTVFETQSIAVATSCKVGHLACFRIHLAQLQILALEAIGDEISDQARAAWCGATDKTDIPLTDWYCGRLNPNDWLRDFAFNQWEYRHQRCGAWENPDGDEGLETPALDFMLLYWLSKP